LSVAPSLAGCDVNPIFAESKLILHESYPLR
jgi:hypothetical protein